MKIIKYLVGFGAISYLATITYVNYADIQRAESIILAGKTEAMTPLAFDAFQIFAEKGCSYCHAANSQLPFYASFPIAKQLMEKDVEVALRHFQIEPMLAAMQEGRFVKEVDLAKIEDVMETRSMPPQLYLFMHWGSYLNDKDRDRVLEWIDKERRARHKNSPAAEAFKNEPVQPIYSTFPVNEEKVSLGNALYHDVRLSTDNTISCASCHDLSKGGVDGLNTSTGVGGAKGPINAPTVFNAVFNSLQFWDGRADSLQEQAGGPPLNPLEMASTSWAEIIGKLQNDPQMRARFSIVYSDGITEKNITDAIAEFEKTLTTPDSTFDLFLKGNRNALTLDELEGYELFKSNQCDTCHSGEAMGGNALEIMGLKKDYFADRGNVTQVDNGRFNVTADKQDMYRFKVPTLRNISLTAPYFHDASVKTLEEAVEKMGYYQVGVKLTPAEIKKITAFLGTLNGQVAFAGNPK